MERSLREILADSHIAAVAIMVLLIWILHEGFQASVHAVPLFFVLYSLVKAAAYFLATAVAIRGMPASSHEMNYIGWFEMPFLFESLFTAIAYVCGAWLLSRWVYGVGPLRGLREHRTRLARRNHA